MQTGERIVASLGCFIVELLEHDTESKNDEGAHQIAPPFTNTTPVNWVEAVRLWNMVSQHLISDIPPRSCPVCESSDNRHLFNTYDGYPYVECFKCGCWFVPLIVDAALFERFYALCPQALKVADLSFAKRQSEENLQTDLKRFDGYLDLLLPLLRKSEKKSYLDIGCGLGHSLMAARARGLEAVGIESDQRCVSICRQVNLDVRHTTEPLLDNKYHLITFWESLEHMADPGAALMRFTPLLHDEGLIAFTVPNQNSPLVKIQRADCFFINGGFDTPGHINMFSPSTIEMLLSRCGYTLLHIDGLFGSNLFEIMTYLIGQNRAAADVLSGKELQTNLSLLVSNLLTQIGPLVTLIERTTLTSPILFCIACRTSSAEYFLEESEKLRKLKKNSLLDGVKHSCNSAAMS